MNSPLSRVPEQCRSCLNFSFSESLCRIYEHLPGEYSRKDVTSCPSFLDRAKEDQLTTLARYIDEDPDEVVTKSLERAIGNILDGYQDKFKVMVVGIARRKIKAIVRMVDVIDRLIDKLSDDAQLQSMSANQSLRLLSELNASVNNDLSFIMKLISPDSTFKDIQAYIDNRQININGTSPETSKRVDDILSMSSTSREKVREAFDALLYNLEPMTSDPVKLPGESEVEDA